MKTIGMLGGMSWESSIAYERLINTEVRRRLGGVHSADLIIRSYDFDRIERLQAAGDWAGAGALLASDAARLQRAGADCVVLCTNTMHRLADAIEAAISVPFLHIADTTAEAARRAGVKTLGLLGTRYTMEGDFYRGRLERGGLGVVVPDDAGRARVHAVIYDELVQGRIEPSSRAAFVEIAAELVARGAEGVVAGCTEIELLLRPEDVTVPYFPTARLHALAAVEFALAVEDGA